MSISQILLQHIQTGINHQHIVGKPRPKQKLCWHVSFAAVQSLQLIHIGTTTLAHWLSAPTRRTRKLRSVLVYGGSTLVIVSVPWQRRMWASVWYNPQPAPTYILTRWLFLRLLGVTYLCAYASLWPQLRGLIGQHGLLPAAAYLEALREPLGRQRYRRVPTLAWLWSDDPFLLGICGTGICLSLLLVLGVCPVPVLVGLWIGYLSLVTISQDFLAFQWDALLLETGFLAIFFAPPHLLPQRSREPAPPRIVLWLLRLLVFRLMFASGVVKLRSGDPTWRDLTALTYHYQTQPLPTPPAWYIHHLPRWFHQFSTAWMLAVELLVPFFIFAPRSLRLAGAGSLTLLQALIALTGNYGFFNLLSASLYVTLLDDAYLRRWVPARWRTGLAALTTARPPLPQRMLAVPLATLILVLNVIQIARLFRLDNRLPRVLRAAGDTFAPLHLVNSYGLFAVMTTRRPEIVVEGSHDGQHWVEYSFRYKPGDPNCPPPWVAPHQPRLDWQMWFAALGQPWGQRWFPALLTGLLRGTPEILSLLETNPFPAAPPRYVRALLYDYRFTQANGGRAWWERELLGLYFPPVSLT